MVNGFLWFLDAVAMSITQPWRRRAIERAEKELNMPPTRQVKNVDEGR